MGTILKAPEAGWKYPTTQQTEMMHCARCSMMFGVPSDFIQRRRDDHNTFYCPNGHSNWYPGKSDKEKLQDEVAWLRRDTQWHDDQRRAAEKDAAHQRRVAAAAKGRITKMKNRIAAGVCPAPGCKRSGLGKDVAAHLKTCHPDSSSTMHDRHKPFLTGEFVFSNGTSSLHAHDPDFPDVDPATGDEAETILVE